MSTSAWGTAETKYFFELTPEKILDAVEASGLRCTGRVLTLNSMENRVYEVEIELDGEKPANPSDRFRIVKFYRPGRWSKEQILEEHQFLDDLVKAEIPVVTPVPFPGGETLKLVPEAGIWYALFAKAGGRSPDELLADQAEQIGRLLARIHTVGKQRKAPHRIQLSPATYGLENLEFLLDAKLLPADVRDSYKDVVTQICQLTKPWFDKVPVQRIHGDCHLGNLLWGSQGAFFVDFDDMVRGPVVQDFWLMLPGRDEEAKRLLDRMLDGYEQFSEFPYESLKLIEALRALRFIHFSAWIGKRWQDPAFQRAFNQYGSLKYWEEQLSDLREQLSILQAVVTQ